MRKRILSLAAAASLAGMGIAGLGSSPAAQACPSNWDSQQQGSSTQYVYGDEHGGIYTSGGDPSTNQNGYVGATGDDPTSPQGGYIEAGGDRNNPTGNGYVVASEKPAGPGIGVQNGNPGIC